MNLVYYDNEVGTYVDRLTQDDVDSAVRKADAGEFRQITRNKLGSLEIDATLREDHVSEVVLTDHPVEKGVDITDHKRITPKQVTIEGVISASPLVDLPFDTDGLDTDAWETLVKLQEGNALIDITTTLRTYEQMSIVSLNCTRDAKTGNALRFTAVLRQVFTATSETVAAPPTARPKQKNLGKKQTEEATPAQKKSLAKKLEDAGIDKIKGALKSVLP